MYNIPSTPLTLFSIGAATVSDITCAFAPGYAAVTDTVGGVISGYSATGKFISVITPANIISSAITKANIGRLIKNFDMAAYFCFVDSNTGLIA
jgi:hypothetical protein